MLSHVTIAVSDLVRARDFSLPLMTRLGFEETWLEPGREAAFREPGSPRPLFFLTRPFEGEAQPGNGPMVAFLAPDRATVEACFALAMAAGAKDEGGPGLRPRYHPNFYGAYFRDPDRNKVCVACHAEES
ncbi:MAG: VOC family protein [Rhodobacteraceae bacterium]|nr:VOC family protein [Paracoccaceae bacterium]MBR9822694.1 VOC family protein [Paracoccaceae bacterium]